MRRTVMIAPGRPKCGRSRITREKENIFWSTGLRHSEKSSGRKLDSGLSIFRRKVQSRILHCQELLESLDQKSRQMKVCFLELMDLVEKSKTTINDEKEENMQVLQMLEDCFSEKRSTSLKTQTVSPMISGVALKKASISLRRVDPFQETQNQISPAVVADSASASDVGFSQAVCVRPLSIAINPLQNILPPAQSSASEDEEFRSVVLPRLQERFGRQCKTSPLGCPKFRQGYRLKTASIQLHRLDPRPYLSVKSVTEPNETNMPAQKSEKKSNILESAFGTTVSKRKSEQETYRNGSANTNSVSWFPIRGDPKVVLERLQSLPNCCDKNSQLLSSGHCSVLIRRDSNLNNIYKNVCETREKYKKTRGNTGRPRKELTYVRKRKAENSCCVSKKRKFTCKNNPRKRFVNNVSSKIVVKKKKLENLRIKKKRQIHIEGNSVKKTDEDPLEGPSWLYKDGIKIGRLKKMKKIRQAFLTPIYYLSPTIYPSTDESEDETRESDKKKIRLRKKKTRRNR